MKKLLVVLLALTFTAFAFASDVDKAALKETIDAYNAGIEMTKAQDALLSQWGQTPVIDNLGGPDAAGYSWKDSEEVDGPTYGWIDITGTGTSAIANVADDNTSGPYPIGFGFTFYGTTYTDFYVGSNGAINFDGQYISLSNYAMPYGSYQAMIAFFWDDMDPADATDADLLYETMMVGGQNALVISFLNWDEYPGNADPAGQESVTAQIILFEDGTVQIHYFEVQEGIDISSCTIGIQDASGSIGLTALYNGSILAYPYSQLAIEFGQAASDASLSGYVYDSSTDIGIDGAEVTLGGMTTLTDPSGFYEFLDVFSGPYTWGASAFGYIAADGLFDVLPGANVLDIYLDPINMDADVLIVDVDPTPLSGPAIDGILQGMGYTTLYTNNFLEYPFGNYEYVFVCTGIYPNYFAVGTGSDEETVCVDYLNGGGNLYLEGGDLYGYIPPANLLAMLQLTGISDGGSDLANVLGEGSLAGLDLAYAGENSYIDHIEPDGGATRLLNNPADGAGCGVIDNSLPYHTACLSFELGGLVDGDPWTRADIVGAIMDNFNYTAPPVPGTLTLLPLVTDIPAEGGTVVFDGEIQSNLANTHDGSVWAEVVGPAGTNMFVSNRDVTVAPGLTVYPNRTLDIPAWAPPGEYTLNATLGVFPVYTIDTDAFTFTKHPPLGEGLFEDFEDGLAQDFAWHTGLGTYLIDGGYAKMDQMAEASEWGSGVYTGDTFGSFSASTIWELVQTTGNSVGVLFRGSGVNDATYAGYAVYTSNGHWSAWSYDGGGGVTNLVGWTADPAILMGVGAINNLQVDGSGDTFDVSCNGTYLGSFADAGHATGYAGFTTCYGTETWYAEISCSHPVAARWSEPIEIGDLDPVLRDHTGNVITDPADYYTPGVAFDRSAEFTGEPFGMGSFIADEDASVVGLPTSFEMGTAYPNPFNPSTSVAIALPNASDLTVSVFNIMGQHVATLANGKFNAGQHTFSFDASNLSSGLYFIQAQVPGEMNMIQKVTLMK